MTTLQNISLTCPICTASVESMDVVTTNSFGGKRTDFHEKAAGTQPLPFLVHTCTNCGFSGTTHDFGDDSEFVSIDKILFRDYLTRIVKQRPLHRLLGSDKFELAALIAEWNGMGPRHIADRWLKAAWCCVDEGDIEAERYYRIKAANAFIVLVEKPFLDSDDLGGASLSVYYYLVGELWRRAGFVDRAKEWFDKVPSTVVDKTSEQWVCDAARQQRDQPREWFG